MRSGVLGAAGAAGAQPGDPATASAAILMQACRREDAWCADAWLTNYD
jgi:hypothetical protein